MEWVGIGWDGRRADRFQNPVHASRFDRCVCPATLNRAGAGSSLECVWVFPAPSTSARHHRLHPTHHDGYRTQVSLPNPIPHPQHSNPNAQGWRQRGARSRSSGCSTPRLRAWRRPSGPRTSMATTTSACFVGGGNPPGHASIHPSHRGIHPRTLTPPLRTSNPPDTSCTASILATVRPWRPPSRTARSRSTTAPPSPTRSVRDRRSSHRQLDTCLPGPFLTSPTHIHCTTRAH